MSKRRSYDVEYTEEAQDQLLAIYLEARQRSEEEGSWVTHAANQVDKALAEDPISIGDAHPRLEGVYIYRHPPLRVYYAIPAEEGAAGQAAGKQVVRVLRVEGRPLVRRRSP